MINKIRSSSLFRSAGVYTLSNIVNSAVPFLLIPVFTRFLSPEDYGIVAMFQVVVGVAGPFIGLSVHGAIGRQYVEKSKDELAVYIANCLMLLMCTSALFALVVMVFGDLLYSLSALNKNWLITVCVFSFCQFIIQISLVLWQMQEKPKQYAIFSFILTALNASLSLYAIIILGMGWQGRLTGQVTASISLAIISLIILFRQKWIKFKYNRIYVISALSFGLPLIPHALSAWVIEMVDRVFVTNIVGVAQTGVYAVGYQIGMVVGILEGSFIQAWVPYLYKQLKENTETVKLKLVKFTYLYCLSLVLVVVVLTYAAKVLMPYFVGKKFEVAETYVLWIALGYAFNGMYKMMAGYFFYFEKTRILAGISTASAFINIFVTYVLVVKYGAIGAAYSTTISFLITFIMTWVLVDKVNKMPWLLVSKKN